MNVSPQNNLTRLTSLVIGFLLSAICLTARTDAATFTVTNHNDSGPGSLRQACLDAGATTGAHTVNFDANVTGIITLTSGELLVGDDMTIIGPGASTLTISGNNTSRVILCGARVTISGLTITKGNGTGMRLSSFNGSGGGIFSLGRLTLTNCHITENTAALAGGGVYLRENDGVFTDCTFSKNTAGSFGGGILFDGKGGRFLGLTNCTISENKTETTHFGSGILSSCSEGLSVLQISNCTFFNNGLGGSLRISASAGATTITTISSTLFAHDLPLNNIVADGPGTQTVTSQGFNLTSDNGGGFLTHPTDLLNMNPAPWLGPLAFNGGPTPTHALLPGSPALDKGISNGLATDQRGMRRIIDLEETNGSDGTDIGAFELDDGKPRVSGTRAGSVLVFPYYTSAIGRASDTRISITNIAEADTPTPSRSNLSAVTSPANIAYVHLFLIEGITGQQVDFFLCLSPNASFSCKVSEFDPGNTGYVLAVAITAQGVPVQNNVLGGNAFVTTPQFADNYTAQSFWANSPAVATLSGNTATLNFDNVGYDAVPSQFMVEIQSPLDVAGQQIVTASLRGNLLTGQLSGAAQMYGGRVFRDKEAPGVFHNWLMGAYQAKASISTTSPRIQSGLGKLIPTGQTGVLQFDVGGAAGLLMTPRTAKWKGIRTLHNTQTTISALTIPLRAPQC